MTPLLAPRAGDMTYHLRLHDGTPIEADRVTEIIRAGMPRPRLDAWLLREAARYVMENSGRFPNVDALLAAWRRDSQKASARGIHVHRIIAATLRDDERFQVPAHCVGYIEAFDAWRSNKGSDWCPTHVEQTLASPEINVAGTADVIFDRHLLVDWKTADKTSEEDAWPDQVAQVGAYASLRTLVADGAVTGPVPRIEEARIVRLHADGTWHETVLEGTGLDKARDLWRHVLHVARAAS